MAKQTGRSLKLSAEELVEANRLLAKFGSKTQLAADLGMSRTTITKFKGETVQGKEFLAICKKLKLNWQAQSSSSSKTDTLDIDALVQTIRTQVKPDIQERCSTMRVLDMTQPIQLTGDQGIYTHVNILEKLTSLRRLKIKDLLKKSNPEEFDRFGLNRVTEKRIPGLEAVQNHRKLMVLGKPGAGKTTFLKYLAMHCIEGEFLTDRVPFFITLKDFAETAGQPDLLDYLSRTLPNDPVGARHWAQTPSHNLKNHRPNAMPIHGLLRAGRLLILLDGLDEVREEDTPRVIRQIREFSDSFAHNQFVITCRIAAKEYTFERFTEVEVADFDKDQIADFAQKWFQAKGDAERATLFSQKLEQHKPIQELATNPLLLTLLCLVFETATDFPANRSELYKEGLDILLKKWDGSRKIERDQVYQKLSLKRKEDLLSQIALTTFTDKEYFIKQKHLEAQISDYIGNLPDAKTDPAALHLDSEAVLKSIAAQHGLLVERAKGIYSFSHLTFHEYFAAREIVSNPGTTSLPQLVEHLTEKRWREVFLLTVGMMRNADELVKAIKEKTDRLLVTDKKIQTFLYWISKKVLSTNTSLNQLSVRIFYFVAERTLNNLNSNFFDFRLIDKVGQKINLSPYSRSFTVEDELIFDFHLYASLLSMNYSFMYIIQGYTYIETDVIGFLNGAFNYSSTGRLKLILKKLINQLPPLDKEKNTVSFNEDEDKALYIKTFRELFPDWFKLKGQAWTEQLRAVMIEHRDIGHDWQFSAAQSSCCSSTTMPICC
jgi:predicted NACHT family NTPase